jgi:Ser/Thr protein kinase RdoA (MazF antagonist)
MLGVPDVDPVVLTAALIREFGLSDSTLRSIPAGETSWCFEATDGCGGRWFVKLTPEGAIAAGRAEFALRLGRALADLGLPVPRPMLTRSGALWSRLQGLRLAVFEFVDGEPLTDRELWAAGTVDQVAELVAAIHAAAPALGMPVPAETFTVWADGLGRRLAELEFVVAGSGEAAEVRALVWPQRAALLREVSGDLARHARLKGDPPKRTMTLVEARQLIGSLVIVWLDWLRSSSGP